ncbi:hypothetical protein BDQ12DRAFT_740375 [Crucibulum laeve]|uniref:Transmembrane protein n=1 Tax=Crucibulum laeve TaxID=68775 RepID=A0A5C3MHA7_9AGAR|nr:hypothetical protein BDQ12DRAFT_740375 [Crucibulum laeve]
MSTIPKDPRRIIVDDTDNSIRYSGDGWFQDHGSRDSFGNLGPTYLHTLHGVNNNASFSFSFTGSTVIVQGTINLTNTSGVIDPTWECFVDGLRIGPASFPGPSQFNNWALCDNGDSNLVDRPHELTVNVSSRGNTFWLDSIQYVPSSQVPLDDKTVRLDDSDPSIKLDGWEPLGDVAVMTQKAGATMTMDFVGKSLSWFSFIPTELPHIACNASYTIDGGNAQLFVVPAISNSSPGQFNKEFFTTADLTPGPHRLVVTHHGTSTETPLTLDYIYVTNGSLPTSSTSSSSSLQSTSSPTPTLPSNKNIPIGPIAGGVTLGVICLGIFAAIIFFRRRRIKSSASYTDHHIPEVSGGNYLVPFTFPVAGERNPQTWALSQGVVSNKQLLCPGSLSTSAGGFTSTDFSTTLSPYHMQGTILATEPANSFSIIESPLTPSEPHPSSANRPTRVVDH